MASGPEHYTEAERLLASAKEADAGSESEDYCLRAAAVHARLAEAANAALIGDMDDPEFLDQLRAWRQATQPILKPGQSRGLGPF